MKDETVIFLALLALVAGISYLALRSSASPLVPVTGTRYQNDEVWEIVRNGTGYISQITIHRDAKAS